MSRPKGSKNKPKIAEAVEINLGVQKPLTPSNSASAPIIKRGRGRPRKIKQLDNELEIKKDNTLPPILFGNVKDIKKQIREMRRIKLDMRAGTVERVELHRKIKELKNQLKTLQEQKQSGQDIEIKIKTTKTEPILSEEEKNTKYSNDNGCMYFNYCKKLRDVQGKNDVCYHPKYCIEKLDRKCSQLNN